MSDHQKPSEVPTWATNGERVKPPAEKQTQGFVPRERAASQYFNWIFNAIGGWLQWLDNVFGRPVSAIAGLRYLALRGDDEAPGIELQSAAGGDNCGEVQWSDTQIAGSDKRLVSMSADAANGMARLNIHVRRTRADHLGDPCASLYEYGMWLQSLTTGGLKLELRDPDDYVHLEEGSHSINVFGRSRVCVLFHETNPELSEINGGSPGQVLLCQFLPFGGLHWNTLTLRNGTQRHQFRLKNGDVIIHRTGTFLSPCCLFINIENQWRLIASDF